MDSILLWQSELVKFRSAPVQTIGSGLMEMKTLLIGFPEENMLKRLGRKVNGKLVQIFLASVCATERRVLSGFIAILDIAI